MKEWQIVKRTIGSEEIQFTRTDSEENARNQYAADLEAQDTAEVRLESREVADWIVEAAKDQMGQITVLTRDPKKQFMGDE